MNECHCVLIRRLEANGNKDKQIIPISEINYQIGIYSGCYWPPHSTVFFREGDEDQVMSK